MKNNVYSHYKDSGVKWFGKIPIEWSSVKLKNYLDFTIGGTPPTSIDEYFEGNYVWITISDLSNNKNKFITDSKTKISKDAVMNSNVQLVKKGSLLYSFKLTVGEVAFAGCDLYTNEAIASFEYNNEIFLGYLKYLLKVGFENNAFENIYGAKIFNSDLIKNAKILKPTFNEQIQIAKYLDKKIKNIEKIISKNKELISLLKEKRAVLINTIVTRGLNHNIKLKNSGVKFIDKIPEDWSIIKIKFISSKIGSGVTPKGGSQIYLEKGIPLIRSQNVHNFGLKLDDVVYISEDINNTMLNSLVKKEDVLLNITGASIGRCFYVENLDIANVNQHVCIIRSNSKIFYKFLYYFLISAYGQEQIFSIQTGTSREAITIEDIKNIQLVLPPLNCQKQLVSYLDNKIFTINKAIQKIQIKLNLLEEYENSLIYHVVTGKINVQGVLL
ncbi:MAG: restriction endonuclease subunit S [Methanosphaera stadtmanae]|nr:restriction endonuclease subunit S [Methanosphaera stadtmanae]